MVHMRTSALIWSVALALSVALSGPVQAQEFLPFEPSEDELAPPPLPAFEAPPPAEGEEASKEEAEKKEGEAAAKGEKSGEAEAAADDGFAPFSPPPLEGAPDEAAAGAEGVAAEGEASPAEGAGAEAAPDADGRREVARRVVSEGQVDEQIAAIEGASSEPATLGNALLAPSNHRAIPGAAGATGLASLPTADLGAEGSLRLGVTTEFFSMSDFLVAGDLNRRQAASFSVAWTPIQWVEVYGAMDFSSNTNPQSLPALLQVQGRGRLGVKGGMDLTEAFRFAGDLRLDMLPTIGAIGVGEASLAPRLLATYDLRPELAVPVRLHAEAGAFFTLGSQVAPEIPLTRIEEFALGLHRFHRLAVGLGVEAPLPYASPYMSWRLRAPLGQLALPFVIADDGSTRQIAYTEVISNVLTLGAKVTALPSVTLNLGVELGLSGAAVEGVPATMPWNVFLGFSFAGDPTLKGERVTLTNERVVEVEMERTVAPPVGHVAGLISDSGTQGPLGGAVVTVEGVDGQVASGMSSGRYLSYPLPPGSYTLTADREGYDSETKTVEIAAGDTQAIDFALVRQTQNGEVMVKVVDAKGRKALAARIEIRGPVSKSLSTDEKGRLSQPLPPGKYLLNVSAEGFLTRQRDLVIEEDTKVATEFELPAKPKKTLIIVQKDRIELKRQIHFRTGRATIMTDSYQILDEVIDAIATHDIKKVRIEGHTDSQGSDAKNKRLSQARADAVRDYLVQRGIAPDRISSFGFGEERPVAPNATASGRALNRRVEFHIEAE